MLHRLDARHDPLRGEAYFDVGNTAASCRGLGLLLRISSFYDDGSMNGV
jgi:hypothetical protein